MKAGLYQRPLRSVFKNVLTLTKQKTGTKLYFSALYRFLYTSAPPFSYKMKQPARQRIDIDISVLLPLTNNRSDAHAACCSKAQTV